MDSQPSKVPCWKLRVGKTPWLWVPTTVMAVPWVRSGGGLSWVLALKASRYFVLAALKAAGSARETSPSPRTTTAFRFLDPMTAPTPARPAARSRSFMMAANSTCFSPAGPITAVLALAWVSPRRASSVSWVVLPHRWPAGRSSARSPSIQR